MALTDNDKKWMSDTFAIKEDLKDSEKRIDEKIRSLATREEVKEIFKAQNEFFSNALRNQTQEILNSVASRERVERLESQVAEMDERIEALERTQKQAVAV